MKRRMATSLGVFAAAAAMALTAPGSAYAAEGVLVINGGEHKDPSGCYSIKWYPSSVTNRTDAVAEVYTGQDCTGRVEELVQPGETYHSETAGSVFIP
ncbi:hypothetical protein C5F59_034780 [Streptomyces sp. QL37]|uniref:hypothetical protein n=1 Tax=Streptomyces sp. QL37 TaxID=2093747 RepID=UPI000CF1D27B|nr:hypothetical protein [Streptomyces sp. QL37]PPQ61353.1 hypothetical protein C5F59_35275 [Streptomyces sp. QL37]